MNEIVDQIAARVGIPAEVAEKALGMMLGFLQREAADGPVAKMIEAIPGASDLVAKYNGEGEGGGGGILGSIMGALGGGGIMALGQQLMSEGLGMGEITDACQGNHRDCRAACRQGSRRRGCRLGSGSQPVRLSGKPRLSAGGLVPARLHL